jgi:hypothetical protein
MVAERGRQRWQQRTSLSRYNTVEPQIDTDGDEKRKAGEKRTYSVIAINSTGLSYTSENVSLSADFSDLTAPGSRKPGWAWFPSNFVSLR